ncbi:hypothetical protein Gasu2_60250 [Galdieria sulphuraria]|nr:hypothetical protein Gasu2_60250 [Galdieria sulphuraria]
MNSLCKFLWQTSLQTRHSLQLFVTSHNKFSSFTPQETRTTQNTNISKKSVESDYSSSPLDAAKSYVECIAALTEWSPTDLNIKTNKNSSDSNSADEERKQSLLDVRRTTHNTLWEVLKKPPAPQKMKLFSVRQITQSIIQSFAHTFVDVFPRLDISRKARMMGILMVDFPTHSSIVSKLYPSLKLSSSMNLNSQDWDDDYARDFQGSLFYYPGVEKYYGWFFYWNFFSLLLNHPKGLEVLCDVRYLLNIIYTPEQVKQLESYFLVDRPFQVATDSISWLVRYNHRVLAPCFGQSFLRVHELNANYAPFLVAYSRALKRLHAVESQDEGNRRIQYKYRRIYALTQIGLPSIPLSFCEVVFLPQPATSLHQIEELIKNDESNLSTSYPTVIEHIRSFMLPRMNFFQDYY